MGKYTYKNIHIFIYWGMWQADYKFEDGRRIPLHRCCCLTKADAYEIGKREVDYLNEKEKERKCTN